MRGQFFPRRQKKSRLRLEKLIIEQLNDRYSRHVSRPSREITIDPKILARICLTNTEGIVHCKMSGQCPRCRPEPPQYDKSTQSSQRTRLVAGMDVIKRNGEITAVKCCCNFSF